MIIDDDATEFTDSHGTTFVRVLDGATTDEQLEELIASNIAEVLFHLAGELADDDDIDDEQAARLLARAAPMVAARARANLTAMRAKLRH